MTDAQGDDFDDLFSFGAEDTAATIPAPSPSLSDFDLLADLNTPAPAPAPAVAVDDEFDALFGTPPGTPITSKTPLDLANDEELPCLEPTNVKQYIDDFHVHDAGTRDFLEWLDDDTDKRKELLKQSGGDNFHISQKDTKNGENQEFDDDDDFDFDQMLAEADVSSSLKSSNQSARGQDTTSVEQRQTQPYQPKASDIEIETTVILTVNEQLNTAESSETKKEAASDWATTQSPALVESRKSQLSNGFIAPEPISKPYVSACIEDELSFDKWNDDADDFHIAATDEGYIDQANEATERADITDATKLGSQTISPAKVSFNTLAEAIKANTSTIDDVRVLFNREKGRSNMSHVIGISSEDRPYLWTKVICGKIHGELDNDSIAESFSEWQKKNATSVKYSSESFRAMIEIMLLEAGNNANGVDNDLRFVLEFHDNDLSSTEHPDTTSESIDPLIPPVIYAILQSGIPPPAANVILSQIERSFMPLLELTQSERYSAAKNLHMDFYLLACYHLPLLVMHLDRQCPGWYWPKQFVDEKGDLETISEMAESTNVSLKVETAPQDTNKHTQENGGLVPLSWFINNFAGELGKSCLDHKMLLPIWDYLLTTGDRSKKFFLGIAILDKYSDLLLMSRGEELKIELEKVLNFKANSFDEDAIAGADGNREEITAKSNNEMVFWWLNSAQSLSESTPSSFINLLRSIDDRTVTDTLTARKAAMDAKAKADLEAEETTKKKEREERDTEAKRALIKARLVSYYRDHNPEKVDTVDQIYNMFDGRFDVLNEKLKKKYGMGFLPDEPVKDQVSHQTRSFFESVNKSITETKKHVSMSVAERRKKNAKSSSSSSLSDIKSKVALEISPTEIIPYVCSTKGHHPVTGEKWSTESHLKFYLIDCRPEETAKEQGRFPTSVNMGPQKLQDPDELQQLTDMFEALRGAVHICVMGEGFSSFPALYDHPLTFEEEKLLEDDTARTSDCCLFFLKKGFPFVSILKGGFAAAHAFLWRNGPDMGLPPSNVLVDYDPFASLFAQLETSHQDQEYYKNAPTREKTAKALQKIIDNSMTRLTMEEQRFNGLASDFTKPENVDKMKQSVRSFSQKVSTTSINFGKTPPLFMTKKAPSPNINESANTEQIKQDSTKLTSITSFKQKMVLKGWHSESADNSKEELKYTARSENVLSEGSENINDESERSTPIKRAEGENKLSRSECESSDSLCTTSLDSVQPEREPSESTSCQQVSSTSQFRLKMNFSSKKVTDDNTEIKQSNDDKGDKLKNAFGFLKKSAVPPKQDIDEKYDPHAAKNGPAIEVKNPFSLLKKQVVDKKADQDTPAVEADSVPSEGMKNNFASLTLSFGTMKKQNDAPTYVTSDVTAKEAKSKFASFTKSFGTKSLPEKEAIERADSSDKKLPPSSPVKASLDSFSNSLKAVKQKTNKLLNEISEHDDPFIPKNSRHIKTRFSGAQSGIQSTSKNQTLTLPTESLLFMEDDHDDGLEDEIDFGIAADTESRCVVSDPFEAAPDDLFSGLNAQPPEDSLDEKSGGRREVG